MKNVTIRIRLFWLAALITSALITQAALSLHALSTIDRLNMTAALIQTSQIDILTLRKHEKDFLARLNLDYQQKFNARLRKLDDQLTRLTQNLSQLGLDDRGVLAQLQQNVHDYQQTFKNIVDINVEIGLDHNSGLRGQLRTAVHQAEKVIKQIHNPTLMADMLMLRRNEKDFMLRRNEKYIAKFKKNYQILTQDLSQLDIDPSAHALIKEKMMAYHRMFLHFTEGYKRLGLTPNDGLQGAMRKAVHATENKFAALNQLVTSTVQQQHDSNSQRMIIVVIVSIGFIIGVLFIISRTILSRLTELRDHMSNVALAGKDLTAKLNIAGQDEITAISHLFNRFLANLHETFVKIPEFSQTLLQTADKNASMSAQTYQLSVEQQNETEQAVSGISQIASASKEIAQHISQAAESASQTNQTAQDGRNKIQQISDEMEHLAAELKSSTALTKELDDNSNNISVVVDVIQEIAEQTNLLALNAAIEAARAGENGRGFAVVADEVRTLAQRTQESTQQIQSLITALQKNVSTTIEVMHQASEKTLSTSQNTSKARETLETISQEVKRIFEVSSNIASAADQQAAVSEGISHSVHNIAEKSKEMTRFANDSNLTSEQIKQIAEELQKLIAAYKL